VFFYYEQFAKTKGQGENSFLGQTKFRGGEKLGLAFVLIFANRSIAYLPLFL